MAFLQNVSVLHAAANMLALVPGAEVKIGFGPGRSKAKLENIGAGSVSATAMQSNI